MASYPSPDPSTPPTALVVRSKGAARRALARTLEAEGRRTTEVADPFRALNAFALAPADVVVVDIAGWRRRDLGFLAAVRLRAPDTIVVATCPPSERRGAAKALDAGADVVLDDPIDLDELVALVRRLSARVRPPATVERDAALRSLCADVGHAINNPLQVASLLLETAATPTTDARGGVLRELQRIQEVVARVTAFGRLPVPAPVPVPLGRIVNAALSDFTRERPLAQPHPAAADDATVLLLDEPQLGAALGAALRFLAARSSTTPLPLRIAVVADADARVDLLLRVEGVRLEGATGAGPLTAILDVDERTREVRTGLGFVRAIVEAHGGELALRTPTSPEKASVLRFRFRR